MVDIKENMYVRYVDIRDIAKVAKIVEVTPEEEPFIEEYYRLDNEDGTLRLFIKKASYNIIDLIEKGDYVNGMPVYIYDNQLVINQKDGSYITLGELLKYCNIKSIVTHEQFENMKYEVE